MDEDKPAPHPHRKWLRPRRERIALHNRLVLARRAVRSAKGCPDAVTLTAALDAIEGVLPGLYRGEYDTYGPTVVSPGLVGMLDRMWDRAWEQLLAVEARGKITANCEVA